jgi:dTDP-D-glucose 4,6-dehydratase
MKILVTGGADYWCQFVYYQLANHPEDQIVCVDA